MGHEEAQERTESMPGEILHEKIVNTIYDGSWYTYECGCKRQDYVLAGRHGKPYKFCPIHGGPLVRTETPPKAVDLPAQERTEAQKPAVKRAWSPYTFSNGVPYPNATANVKGEGQYFGFSGNTDGSNDPAHDYVYLEMCDFTTLRVEEVEVADQGKVRCLVPAVTRIRMPGDVAWAMFLQLKEWHEAREKIIETRADEDDE